MPQLHFRWRILLVVMLVVIVAGGYYLIFKSDFFVIKKINCRVENKTSLADEKRWCEAAERNLRDRRIFRFNSTTVVDELTRKFLPVGGVNLISHYPQTVEVVIKERRPAAKVSLPEGLPFLVDQKGVLYSQAGETDVGIRLVILELNTKLSLGQQLDLAVVELILLKEPALILIRFANHESIEAESHEGTTAVFSRQKNLEDQIGVLQTVLKSYKIEGKVLKKVDLRFDKPVVIY